MNVTEQYVVDLLANQGERPLPGALPSDLVLGPFTYTVNLGTAVNANQDVADLRLASVIDDPQLDLIGGGGDNGSWTLWVTRACLILGGTNVDGLSAANLAVLNSGLYLLHTDGARTRYAPLARGVYTPRVQTQRTQQTAADGSFGATQLVRPVPVAPLLKVNMRSDTFRLFSDQASGTFADSANLAGCKLLLYGAAMKGDQAGGRNGPCMNMTMPGFANKLILPPQG